MYRINQWNLPAQSSEHKSEIRAIADALSLRLPTAALLFNRGYTTPELARSFFGFEKELLRDPFLLTDMIPACEGIEQALAGSETITIYGDYDVDGVTSVSSLYLYLTSLGAKVSYYIPNRTGEGYGVNSAALRQLAEAGTSLLLTVDTGVTAVEEMKEAKELGMKVIITDHHECHGELPDALAVINPRRPDCQYPFKELAGAGVAFKLICALEYRRREREGSDPSEALRELCDQYIDLIALGTVADVMPLIDENRLIVSMGLRRIDTTFRPGLKALIEQATASSTSSSPARPSLRGNTKTETKKKITSSTIGYVIAPRINAAGRISTASKAVDLFLTSSEEEAKALAEELCDINRQRQAEENSIIEEARQKIETDFSFDKDFIIILDDDHWHHGVIGIVASRITERYNLPSLLISFDGDIGKGSGRSVKGLNLVEALKSCDDLLLKYGGHELAAGLTITRENLPAFRERMSEYVRTHLSPENLVTSIDADLELSPDDITLKQAEELELLEPCGIANPVPLFFMRSVTVTTAAPIGGGKHTRFSFLSRSGQSLPGVLFGASPDTLGICPGDEVDLLFNLNINEYQGTRTPQLVLRDIRFSDAQRREVSEETDRYEAFCQGGDSILPSEIPGRDDIARLYVCLKRELPRCGGITGLNSLREILNTARSSDQPEMGRIKLRLMLDVLRETGLIQISDPPFCPASERDGMLITLIPSPGKVNLEQSPVYRRLHAARVG